MAGVREWVRKFIEQVKLDRGRCEECDAILRDDAERIDGYRVCSPECAYEAWLQSVA